MQTSIVVYVSNLKRYYPDQEDVKQEETTRPHAKKKNFQAKKVGETPTEKTKEPTNREVVFNTSLQIGRGSIVLRSTRSGSRDLKSARKKCPGVVESWHHAYPYHTYWRISNPSPVEVILASKHTTLCIVHWVSDLHQIWWVFIFLLDGLKSRVASQNSYRNSTSEIMAQGPTRFSLSLSLTLVFYRSLKLCICLGLASMHILGVLDGEPSYSVASWHF